MDRDTILKQFADKEVIMVGRVQRIDVIRTGMGDMKVFVLGDVAAAQRGQKVGVRVDHTYVRHPDHIKSDTRPGDVVQVIGTIRSYQRKNGTTGYGLNRYDIYTNLTTGSKLQWEFAKN